MLQDENQDDILAACMAIGLTHEQAATESGYSRATVTRRMQEPEFRARVAAIRRVMIGRATGILANGAADAAAQVHLLSTSGEPPAIRLKAAIALLDMALRYATHADLEERITRLEESRAGTAGAGGETGA